MKQMKRIPHDTNYFKANRHKQLLLFFCKIKLFDCCLFNHFSINFTYLLLSKPTTKLTGLNKYKKGDFTSSLVAFCQKSVFNCLNPFTNIPGHPSLWDIFKFIFRKLSVTFSIKL